MFATRIIKISITVLALALLVNCGKKEEKAPAASQAQPTQVASLIGETKRNAEALNAQPAGAGAAALPYSQLPGVLDELSSHMEARAQAHQQGADTSQSDTQIAADVGQLQEIQNTMSASQPEGGNKPALDQLSENLTKIIQVVRQGQELKATLKQPKSESGTPPDANMTESAPQTSSTGSDGTTVATAAVSTPAATSQDAPATPPVQAQAAAEQAQLPAAARAPGAILGPCCSVVPNPALKGRLGQLVLTFPQGANAGSTRTDVYKDQTAIAWFNGNKTLELMPGTYAVAITGKRVEGVTIQSGHDTTVKVGLLRVTAGKDTRVDFLDTDKKRGLAWGRGVQELGFPIGTVYVNVAGQSEAVTIEEGKITDF
jgi:hypothetical protein